MSDDARAPLLDPFRPRGARVVGRVLSVMLVVGAVLILVASPGQPGAGYDLPNTVALCVVVGFCVLLLWRHAEVFALVAPEGIRVRNIVRTRTLAWTQVEAVRFAPGEPWVTLDLTDGTTLAVMAIQAADGRRSRAEARRLAELVVTYGHPLPPT